MQAFLATKAVLATLNIVISIDCLVRDKGPVQQTWNEWKHLYNRMSCNTPSIFNNTHIWHSIIHSWRPCVKCGFGGRSHIYIPHLHRVILNGIKIRCHRSVPCIPGACATRNSTYLARGPLMNPWVTYQMSKQRSSIHPPEILESMHIWELVTKPGQSSRLS